MPFQSGDERRRHIRAGSGGEHLISHYIDMTHHAFGTPNDLHGCQVGVATLATAFLYEKLLAIDPQTIDMNDLVAHRPSWIATTNPSCASASAR